MRFVLSEYDFGCTKKAASLQSMIIYSTDNQYSHLMLSYSSISRNQYLSFLLMKQNGGYNIKLIMAGILFAILWASASAATKQHYNPHNHLFDGIFLLPFLLAFYAGRKKVHDSRSIAGILWFALPVSIGAVQWWLFLLRDNPVKAAFWLFLCPVFGFMIAALTLKEPISFFTFIGVALVVAGLYIIQKKK
ncbi:MAG: DMT family transporter [Chitinophagaceae bacterium]|nr:DMT family transporter [Chitinophagaceae bacterium]